jgi:carbonic anhydrase
MFSNRNSLSRSELIRAGAAALSLSVVGAGASVNAANAAPQGAVSPSDALDRLAAGNKRFVSGSIKNYEGIPERRLALAGGQAPYASVLSCSDSRVPPELVFDEHVGDLFVVRNAGNFVFPDVLGTLEYGYSVLGVKLIMVLGHDSCGAISATYDALKEHRTLPPNLDVIQKAIQDGIRSVVTSNGTKNAATIANAKAQATRMKSSPVLGPAIESGDCKVVAAEYHLASGKITFL